jgi:hypothetical protein
VFTPKWHTDFLDSLKRANTRFAPTVCFWAVDLETHEFLTFYIACGIEPFKLNPIEQEPKEEDRIVLKKIILRLPPYREFHNSIPGQKPIYKPGKNRGFQFARRARGSWIKFRRCG